MSRLALAAAGAAAATAALLTPLVLRWARRVGFLDHPGPRKIHAAPVAYGGGLAVAGGVAAGLAVLLALAPGLRALGPTLLVYGAGAALMLALGVVDDRRRLPARFKLLVQAIAAAGVAASGARLEVFNLGPWIGGALTVVWILAVTNAFNLIDHMDGLSGGVAAIAAAAFLGVGLQTGQPAALLVAPLLGACAGFLPWNLPPARIFLGDAGSLFIGFWLSCLTINFTFYSAPYPLYTWFVPPAILAVPLFDTAAVVVIRLLRRRPLFEGDTNHLAHRLVAMGMSRGRAVLAIWALTVYTGLSALLLYHVRETGALMVLGQLALAFGLMTLLEVSGRSHEPPA